MNHKINFLKKSRVKDEYGELIDGWIPVIEGVWARKDELLGNEFFTALTTDSKVEVKFNARWIDGVTNDMRIEHEGKIYEILSSVNVRGRNTELLCYCKLVK